MSLYRPESMNNDSQKSHGSPIRVLPISNMVLSATALIFTVVIIIILSLGEYSRKERVKGHIAPNKGIIRIFPNREGQYSKVFVKNNQTIKKGDPLVEIVGERVSSSGRAVEDQHRQQLDAELFDLELRVKNLPMEKILQTESITNDIKGLEESQKILHKLITKSKKRLAITSKRLKNLPSLLNEKLITQTKFDLEQDKFLNQQQDLDKLEQKLAQDRTRQKSLLIKKQELEFLFQEKSSSLKNQIVENRRKMIEVDAKGTSLINSPASGRVTSLQTYSGQKAEAHNPILTILPDDSELEAILLVPSRSVAFIEKGQTVLLQYNAFPYQKFGVYEGKVTSVAKAAMTSRQIRESFVNESSPLFQVKVSIDNKSIRAFGKSYQLEVGMTLEADIVFDKRSLMDWILEPLYRSRRS